MLFICLGFGEDALWEYLKIGKAIANIIPSRALPREDEDLEKGSVLRYLFLPTSNYGLFLPYRKQFFQGPPTALFELFLRCLADNEMRHGEESPTQGIYSTLSCPHEDENTIKTPSHVDRLCPGLSQLDQAFTATLALEGDRLRILLPSHFQLSVESL